MIESENKEESLSLKNILECDRNIKTYIRRNGSENANMSLVRSIERAASQQSQ